MVKVVVKTVFKVTVFRDGVETHSKVFDQRKTAKLYSGIVKRQYNHPSNS